LSVRRAISGTPFTVVLSILFRKATTVAVSDSTSSCKVIVLLSCFSLNFLFDSKTDVISSNVHPRFFSLALSTLNIILV